MQIVFVSNFYNHHQKPFCDAMARLTSGGFAFVATTPMPEERIRLGYHMEQIPSYVYFSYKDQESAQVCKHLIQEADVAIWGAAPKELFQERLAQEKLTFLYHERIYKRGVPWHKLPLHIWKGFRSWGRHKSLYLLCAGAYVAGDYARLGTFLGKVYKWGYFPSVKEHDLPALLEGKEPRSILWCGRMIDWKHPELPIQLAARLKQEGYQFQVKLVGNGRMEHSLREAIEENHLKDCVQLVGAMKPDQVRVHMEKAGIFIFTSDRNEGWGAVLNEAMNSGCAVVASHAIGAVPYMLEHEQNGLIYQDGNFESLYHAVKKLLDHPELCKELGERAYITTKEQWNADIAAERLLALIGQLQAHGSCGLFENGPCSKAPIIYDGWFKGDQEKP